MDFEGLLSLFAVVVVIWVVLKFKKKNLRGGNRRDRYDDDYYDNDRNRDYSGDSDSGGGDSGDD
ncbi:hypothetical protein [Maridesulfovibrio sp.]|uniref:hypothetical protein n=1 Tax=Maridesulfovibrio sp. TaxID=2795000 RepID=UPI003BA8D0B0